MAERMSEERLEDLGACCYAFDAVPKRVAQDLLSELRAERERSMKLEQEMADMKLVRLKEDA